VLISDITQAVTDAYTTETIADAKMKRLIANAVKYYSGYNPYTVQYDFETVADQAEYDLPSGCIIVIDVLWPVGQLNVTVNTGLEVVPPTRPDVSYIMISEQVINHINADAYYSRSLGSWYVQNQQVVLVPQPGATGSDVSLWYGKDHAINAGGLGYDTIPDEDLPLLRDVTIAEILSGKVNDFAIEPNYTEGLSRETFHQMIPNLQEAIIRLRNSTVHKYGGSAIGQG